MITEKLAQTAREVSGFDRVKVKGHGLLRIEQGDRESLTIETHPELLSKIISDVQDGCLHLGQGRSWQDRLGFALETSLSRKPIRYHLVVKHLVSLEVYGALQVLAAGMTTGRLRLKTAGPNHISFHTLTTALLEVDMRAGGLVEMAGRAVEQRVTVGGPGSYKAGSLKSHNARVAVHGSAEADLWVTAELDAVLRGMGRITYRGNPVVSRRVMGLGSIAPRAQYESR
jgi:hypothetical protein